MGHWISIEELEAPMRACYQFERMNVLEHGYSVFEHFEDLYNHLLLGTALKKVWKIPDWVYEIDPSKFPAYSDIQDYLIYHDCGKPICRVVDDEGKQHFPNHAQVSFERWKEYSTNTVVGELVSQDMLAHTVKGEDTLAFLKLDNAPLLLLSALSEIHSNSVMFGGIESTSFKIKWKHLNKLGKKMFNGM